MDLRWGRLGAVMGGAVLALAPGAGTAPVGASTPPATAPAHATPAKAAEAEKATAKPAPAEKPPAGPRWVVVRARDAAPVVAGTPWAKVAAAVAIGDLDAERRALAVAQRAGLPKGGPARFAARHLEAEVALALGDARRAARILAHLARTADPVAAPWVAAEAVEAGLASGADPMTLRGLLARVPAGHPAGPPARLDLAGVLWTSAPVAHRRRRARVALRLLGRSRGYPGDLGPRAEALRATLLAAAGHREAARRLWLDLYLNAPASSASAPAGKQIAALARRGDHRPTVPERIRRIERLLAAHRNEAVVDAARPLLGRVEPGSRLGCRLRFAVGKAERQARNYRDAISVLSKVAAKCHGPRIQVKALYLWASATSILLKDPAIPIYRRLVREFPRHPYADDALFFIADLDLHADRFPAARKVLEREVAAYPKGDYRGEALWRLFWLRWEAGHPEKGVRWLDTVIGEGPGRTSLFDVSRARYWKARTLARTQAGVPAATALYAKVVEDAPLSYFAAQALGRLAVLDPKRAAALRRSLPKPPADPPGFEAEVSPAFASDPALRDGLHLLRLGLDDAAAKVLEGLRGRARSGAEVRLLARLLDRAGDARAAEELVRTRIPGFDRHYPKGAGWGLWRAAYPLAFRGPIVRWAKRFGIPPDLEQAIIREESALDPKVVSWAGAVGLAQLMPATARDLARQIGLKTRIDVAALKRPSVNLRLSAHYLARLLRQTGGNVALTIAAYNAGVRTVMHWAKRDAGTDLDVFVEEMSIAETRRYTRRVLRTYATYRYLYGPPGKRFLALPATVGGEQSKR